MDHSNILPLIVDQMNAYWSTINGRIYSFTSNPYHKVDYEMYNSGYGEIGAYSILINKFGKYLIRGVSSGITNRGDDHETFNVFGLYLVSGIVVPYTSASSVYVYGRSDYQSMSSSFSFIIDHNKGNREAVLTIKQYTSDWNTFVHCNRRDANSVVITYLGE